MSQNVTGWSGVHPGHPMSEQFGQVIGAWSQHLTEVSISLFLQTSYQAYRAAVAMSTALEEGIPITDPAFYSSESRCPDSLIAHIFRPAARSLEDIPLLRERIAILRQNGKILCKVSTSHHHSCASDEPV